MRGITRSIQTLILWALLAVLVPWALSQDVRQSNPTVTIGIVRDGDSTEGDGLVASIFEEVRVLTEGEFVITPKDDPAFNAGYKVDRVPEALRRALDDPEVDIVLVMGILATRAAAAWEGDLPKPVVSGFVLGANVLDLDYSADERSPKKNLTYVVTLGRARSDVRAFHRMIGFDTLHVLINEAVLDGVDGFRDPDALFEDSTGIRIEYVPAGDTADITLGRIDDGVQAVYLTTPIQLDANEWQRLIDGLNRRKIPTFALRGLPDVERGALAGLLPQMRQMLARRLALNLQQIMLGIPPEDIKVSLSVEERLHVNARTAKQIGYSPDLQTMREAKILHREVFDAGEPLTLEQAMELAAEFNVDMAIQSAELESALQVKNRSRSVLLPQVGGLADYSRIDEERAMNSLGTAAEEQTSLGLEVSQLLYDDEAVTRFRTAQRGLEGERFDYEATRLNVMALAGRRFLEFVQARALHQIESDNLRLTQSNLELARVRVQIGTSGPEDQHRWEAQEAQQRSSLLQAETAVNQARVALNQTLGVPQDTRWIPVDIRLEQDEFYFLDDGKLRDAVSDVKSLERLREFTSDVATRNSPELRGIAEFIAGQELVVNLRKRDFALPSFSAGLRFDYYADRSFLGPQPGETGLPFLGVEPEDDEWIFFVSASFPLFTGGRKFHDLAGARAELDRLSQTYERVRQITEQQSVSALFAMESSHPSIRLSRSGADSAKKNLDIIQDKYAQGAVDIIVLLDAQNESFNADQAAALTVYTYLQDLVAYQRSISWFEKFATDEERSAMMSDMEAYLAGTE